MTNRSATPRFGGFSPFVSPSESVMADFDQIVVTDSCSQALDLACRLLLSPNDTVVVDDPCYFNFHSLLRANRVTVVTVPMTPDGPDVAELERLFAEHRPRLYLTTGGLHNPTGATPSAATVHRMLRLAEEHDVLDPRRRHFR